MYFCEEKQSVALVDGQPMVPSRAGASRSPFVDEQPTAPSEIARTAL